MEISSSKETFSCEEGHSLYFPQDISATPFPVADTTKHLLVSLIIIAGENPIYLYPKMTRVRFSGIPLDTHLLYHRDPPSPSSRQTASGREYAQPTPYH
jgi:hypothetical protein